MNAELKNATQALSKDATQALAAGQSALAAGSGKRHGSLYAAPKKIYARSVQGFFTSWRWAMVWLTQLVFYGLPWLEWGQRQAVLFDLQTRRFYIFGLVLYPQDFIYLAGLLVIAALALFLFTAVAGRIWCGYTCPQTVYSEIFMWIEGLTEGDRSSRMQRNKKPMTADKLWRKTLKHLLWLLISLWTGFTFVAYFVPSASLLSQLANLNFSPWQSFWVLFYGFATYGNAGFMREQVCKYMCPYARFQSVMFDHDTLVVTYDAQRGEPRGARSKKASPMALNLGSCINCTLCVQVCPTGIDIRDGLQYECIGCGACADACDGVMDKMNYPRGLIKYSTENAIKNNWARPQILRHVLRPRVVIYSLILLAFVLLVAGGLITRQSFKVDVMRDRGVMARVVEAGKTENIYRLHIMNVSEQDQRYRLSVSGLPGLTLMATEPIEVAATVDRTIPVRLQLPFQGAAVGTHRITFRIEVIGSPDVVLENSTFIVPKS